MFDIVAICLPLLIYFQFHAQLFYGYVMTPVVRQLGFNKLTANYEYYGSNRENLPLPIQIQLSKKPKIFCCIFFHF